MGELREILIDGVVENIRQAEGALAIWRMIGANHAEINDGGFGNLFGRLQRILGRYAVLATCRIFETETDRYPLKSIPSTLNHLRYNADYLPIQNKQLIIKRLVNFGHDASEFDGIPDPWINQLLRKEFAERLPDSTKPESNELSGAYHNLKLARDKFIAHSESVHEQNKMIVEEQEIRMLLDFAQNFVGVIGKGYLDVDYVFDDGDSMFKIDTDRIVKALEQLLRKAKIVPGTD